MAGRRLVGAGALLWLVTLSVAAAPARARPEAQPSLSPGSLGAPEPVEQAAPHQAAETLFQTAETCMACHNGLISPSGEDVSIGASWRSSMMANSARDPYWQAAVRREVLDHPEARAEIEDECSVCHMPMTTFPARAAGGKGRIFDLLPIGAGDSAESRLAADGVSCTACHQITSARLGTPESFTGGYVIDTSRPPESRQIFGPFQVDPGRSAVMRSVTGFTPNEGTHLQSSELCATCHTLFTRALGSGAESAGHLAEQAPYLEWRESRYRTTASCQSCHMPVVAEEMPIARVLGQPRAGFSRHEFLGGNFFMMRMLNRYRHELGVTATPGEMEAGISRTLRHLQTDTARVSLTGVNRTAGRVAFAVQVENLAGHKFPTAYPSRRAWLHVTVRDATGRVIFESGAFQPDGAVAGNDNDLDGGRFEPHHLEISRSDQVQIYESIMAGADGVVTTGLLTGTRYVKDNRLLPAGFDQRSAGADVAVHGEAAGDPDFAEAGDRVAYVVNAPGGATTPMRIEVELWFQPIGYRWAENLRAYNAPETNRFVRYYDSMASASATVIARAEVSTTSPAGDGPAPSRPAARR